MSRTRLPRSILITTAGLLALTACQKSAPPAAPDPDNIVLHLRHLRVGGQPRPLTPAAQHYVAGILAAEEPLRVALEPFLAFRGGELLWDTGSEQWFDYDAVAQQLARIDALIAEDATAARFRMLTALTAAIDAVPEGMIPEPALRDVFKDAVWSALKWRGHELRELETELMPLVAQHKVLYARALKHAAELQAGQTPAEGPELGTMLAVYANVKRMVLTEQAAEAERALTHIRESATLVEDLKAEKAELLAELDHRQRSDADTARLQWIDDLIAFEQDRRSFFERRAAELEQQLQAEAAAVERVTSSAISSRPAEAATPAPEGE